MHESEQIYKQIIATGREWKGCEQCGRRFEMGEIITAMQIYSGMVVYWECSDCTEEWFGPYDDELKLQPPPPPPEFVLISMNPQTKTLEMFDGQTVSPLANLNHEGHEGTRSKWSIVHRSSMNYEP